MITKDDLVLLYTAELATTAKVIKAIPEDQLEYKPHERSNAVKDLLKTFIVELIMNQSFIKGEQPQNSMSDVPEFTTTNEAAEIYDKTVTEFLNDLNSASADDLLQPFSMWGINGTRADILFGMMRDMIHHRGQFSVYIRLAGGKVPSIYGPSADDNGGMSV